jgi:hypothetical protein
VNSNLSHPEFTVNRFILLSALFASSHCLAAPADDLANRTLKCGSKTLKFSADAWTVTINGRTVRAEWGNGRLDMPVGKDNLEYDGGWTLGDDTCVLR